MKVLFSAVVLAVLSHSVYATESTATVSVKSANLFVQADKNKDGKLDKTEFDEFKQLEETHITQQIHERFNQMKFTSFDQDGNGEVTRDELKAVRMMAHQKGKHTVPPAKTVTTN